jgi:hypothetical protein
MFKWFWVESDTPRISYLQSKSSNSERESVCSGDIHSHYGADQYTGKKNSNEENYIQVGSNL